MAPNQITFDVTTKIRMQKMHPEQARSALSVLLTKSESGKNISSILERVTRSLL
jgi:hypothetical protein